MDFKEPEVFKDYPRVIVMADVDEGAHIAHLQFIDQLGTQTPIPVYTSKEYYHSVSDALKELNEE